MNDPSIDSRPPLPPDDLGGGFRWSWDEIKQMVRRPFSSPDNGSASNGRFSLFRWSKDAPFFRWSFEDLKTKIRQSVNSTKGKGKQQLKRKRGADDDSNSSSVPIEERRARHEEERKAKKKRQEAIRRQKVKEYFIELGTLLGIPEPQSKGAKVKILAAAKEKLLAKKGLSPEQRGKLEDLLEMDLDEDDE